MKIVINKCYGGFGLSDLAYEKLIEYGIPLKDYIQEERNPVTGLYDRKKTEKCIYKSDESNSYLGKYWEVWTRSDEHRTNELVVKVVEELGEKANGKYAELKVIEIPDDVQYQIEEYDGLEWIAEIHRTWG